MVGLGGDRDDSPKVRTSPFSIAWFFAMNEKLAGPEFRRSQIMSNRSSGQMHAAFDGAMILLDEVVEVLRLAHLDVHAAVGAHADDRCRVDPALVDRALLGHAVPLDGTFEESPRCSEVLVRAHQEVDRVAGAAHRALQVLPLAAGRDVSFVHPPARADRALAPAKHRGQDRQHLDRPPMNRGVIDHHTSLRHYLFDLPQAQRVGRSQAPFGITSLWRQNPFACWRRRRSSTSTLW